MYKLTRIFVNKGVFKWQQCIRTVAINSNVNKFEDQMKPWHEIPGPLSLPIVGQLLHFLPGGWLHKRTMELQELLYTNYGPIVRLDGNLGFNPIIYVFDPEAAINLFRKEDPLPLRPGFESILYHRKHFYNKSDDDPSGLIIDNGEHWRKLRFSVNAVMLKPKPIKQYANIMDEVAEDMIQRMRLKRNNENMIEGNLFMEFNLWALESVGLIAFGDRLNCFDPNLPDNSPVKELIAIIHDVLDATEKLDFQPSLWKYFATPAFNRGMKIYEKHMKLNEFFIDKARDQLKKKGGSNENDKSILEKLFEIDRTVAVNMANDMLFAGVDTTASTALGLLYLLAKNIDKQKKLREEVLMNPEKRPYLRACIKESLRLYPILNGNFRKTTKEHNILGYKIPENMNVVAGNQQLCVMEEHFPRPTEFIPERWIVDKSDPLYYGNAHPFAYTPFGFGVRSCIGQPVAFMTRHDSTTAPVWKADSAEKRRNCKKLSSCSFQNFHFTILLCRRIAELELETFVAKVVENFHIEWFGPPPKRTRSSTLNYFLEPYNFIFKDAVV